MRLVMNCPEFSGHLNPMTTLGRALQRRGHEVFLLTRPDGVAKATSAGLKPLVYATETFPPGSLSRWSQLLGEGTGKEANANAVEFFRLTAQELRAHVPELLRQVAPDGLVIDQSSFGLGPVAYALDLPMVCVCNGMTTHREDNVPPWDTSFPYEPENPEARERNRGINAQWDAVSQASLQATNTWLVSQGAKPLALSTPDDIFLATIAQQPAFLDYPREHLPDNFHYIGPFRDSESVGSVSFPWERVDSSRPLIYVSLGTIQNRVLSHFQTIIEGFAAFATDSPPFQLVVSTGNLDTAHELQEWAQSVTIAPIIVPFAPQSLILEKAILAVVGGGLNTVLETLSQGVPLIVVPMAYEQPGIAARVKWLGAGDFIAPENLTVETLRQMVNHVLGAQRYREQAMHAADRMREINGIERGVEVIEQAFRVRQRVLS